MRSKRSSRRSTPRGRKRSVKKRILVGGNPEDLRTLATLIEEINIILAKNPDITLDRKNNVEIKKDATTLMETIRNDEQQRVTLAEEGKPRKRIIAQQIEISRTLKELRRLKERLKAEETAAKLRALPPPDPAPAPPVVAAPDPALAAAAAAAPLAAPPPPVVAAAAPPVVAAPDPALAAAAAAAPLAAPPPPVVAAAAPLAAAAAAAPPPDPGMFSKFFTTLKSGFNKVNPIPLIKTSYDVLKNKLLGDPTEAEKKQIETNAQKILDETKKELDKVNKSLDETTTKLNSITSDKTATQAKLDALADATIAGEKVRLNGLITAKIGAPPAPGGVAPPPDPADGTLEKAKRDLAAAVALSNTARSEVRNANISLDQNKANIAQIQKELKRTKDANAQRPIAGRLHGAEGATHGLEMTLREKTDEETQKKEVVEQKKKELEDIEKEVKDLRDQLRALDDAVTTRPKLQQSIDSLENVRTKFADVITKLNAYKTQLDIVKEHATQGVELVKTYIRDSSVTNKDAAKNKYDEVMAAANLSLPMRDALFQSTAETGKSYQTLRETTLTSIDKETLDTLVSKSKTHYTNAQTLLSTINTQKLTKNVDKSGSRTSLKSIRDELANDETNFIKLKNVPHGQDEDDKIKIIEENYQKTKDLIKEIQSELDSLPAIQSLGSIKPSFLGKENELKNIVGDLTKNVANTPEYVTLKNLIENNTESLRNAGIFPGGTEQPSRTDNENAEQFKTALASIVNDSVKQPGFDKLKKFISNNRPNFVGGRCTPRKKKKGTYRKTNRYR